MQAPSLLEQLSRPPVRALTVLAVAWALFAACALELYAWRYELSSTDIAVRLAVLAAAVGAFAWFRRARAHGSATSRVAIAVAILIGILVVRLFIVNLLHAMLVLGLLTVGLACAWILVRVPAPRWLRLSLVALVLATLHFLIFAYYVLLFIGQETWHAIVSWELIVAYLPRVPDLVAVLPINPWIPYGVVACAYAGFLVVYLLFAGRICQGLLGGDPGLSPRLAVTACFAGVVCAASSPAAGDWLYRNFVTDFRDPLVATLLAEQALQMTTDEMPLVRDAVALARDRRVAAEYRAPALAHAKTLVLITVDALRADQMNVYGHARDNTPFLSRLYREGRLVRVDNAFSTCAVSLCGLASIQTSKYWHQLADQNFTLVDVLTRLGYRSHFLLGGDHGSFYRLREMYGAGISELRDGSNATRYVNDDEQVLDWVADLPRRAATPEFLYVHLMSTHILGLRHPEYKRWQPVTPSILDLRNAAISAEAYANHYHDGILQADAMIERIFARLREKGWLDDAIVIITADHGELLGEGGRFGHGKSLRDPVVRVPLLIYDTDGYTYPARPLASTVDVAPTLVDRIGAPVPSHWAGESLARPSERRFILLRGGVGHAVIGRFGPDLYKYYRYQKTQNEELFNLTRDPHEEHALPVATNAEIVAAMRARVAPVIAVEAQRVRE